MAERPSIPELAEAIADGTDADWATAESGASSDAERAVIRRLQGIRQLADHRRRPSVALDVTTRHAAADPPTGLSQWGPLSTLEKIGEGAFGEVYRAHDPRLARDVALKLLRAASLDGGRSVAIEEGRLLARVRHPNVVTIFGADSIDGRVGIWMELLHGTTLEQLLRDHGPFDAGETAVMGVNLCRALAAVHTAGLVHRDVKAQNVIREDDGRLVLMDFGTGRETLPGESSAVEDLTGTPLYLAPEVLAGEPATIQSDIYSLGVLLNHLLTGSYPIAARNLRELVAAHRANAWTALSDARPGLPAALVDAIDRATHREPSSRFENARDMEAALSVIVAAARAPRRRLRTMSSVVASLLAAGAIALGWQGWQQIKRPRAETRQIIPPPVSAPEPRKVEASPAALGLGNSSPAVPSATPGPRAKRPWVLVAAFDNRTGESMLDGTVEYALQRAVSGSQFVQAVDQDRVNDALALMRLPRNSPLDPATARELCLRDGGIRAFVTGRIQKFGQTYSLKAELIDPHDGSVIKAFPEEAATEEALPKVVDRAAMAIRQALGEEIGSVTPSHLLPHVTTPSFRALELYANALKFFSPKELPVAERYLSEAVAADRGFASAYWLLAFAIRAQQRNRDEYMPLIEKAVDLADTGTRVERDVIVGTLHYFRAYNASPTHPDQHEAELAATALTSALYADPSHFLTGTILESVDNMLRRQSERAAILARAADAHPLNATANYYAAVDCLSRGDIEGAHRYAGNAMRASRDDESPAANAWIRVFPSYEAWARGNVARASTAIETALRTTDEMALEERRLLGYMSALTLLSLGRVQRAAEIAAAMPEDDGDCGHLRGGAQAAILWAQGNIDQLHDLLLRYVNAKPCGRAAFWLWVPAGLGREAQALKSVNAPLKSRITAQIALDERRFPDAVAAAEESLRSVRGLLENDRLMAIEAMAAALVGLGESRRAITVLESSLPSRQSALGHGPIGSEWMRMRAELAALYRQEGREREARAVEGELLSLLSVADADLPLLVELKQRGKN